MSGARRTMCVAGNENGRCGGIRIARLHLCGD